MHIAIRWSLACMLLAAGTSFPLAAQTGACQVDDTAFTTVPGGCKDLASNLIWSTVITPQMRYGPARDYCLSYAEGGTGWRLPTKTEAEAVYQHGSNTHLSKMDGLLWSTYTSTLRGKKSVWLFNFDTGQSNLNPINPKLGGGYVFNRCVRAAGPSSQANQQGGGLSFTHFPTSTGRVVLVHAPALAGTPYVVLGIPTAAGPTAAPVVLLTSRSPVLDPGPGRLDLAGRTTITIDARPFPGIDLASMRLVIALQDPGSQGGISFRLDPPAPR